jgi:hypothetical protein
LKKKIKNIHQIYDQGSQIYEVNTYEKENFIFKVENKDDFINK